MPDSDNTDTGKRRYGTCCFELDIWDANSQAQQTTPRTCSEDGQYHNDGINRGMYA